MRLCVLKTLCLSAAIASALAGCTDTERKTPEQAPTNPQATAPSVNHDDRCANYSDTGMALFGDLHVHTSFSFDAAANTTGATPADAQKYAQGEPIPFWPLDEQGKPAGTTQIDRPLDFLGVTDHGEFLGERSICRTEGSPSYGTKFCENYRANERQGMMMLGAVITTETPERIAEICGEDGGLCLAQAEAPWQAVKDIANAANQPCEFTSFIAYEYTGTPGTSNYHRNVVFRGDSAPDLPVSYIDAPIDSKLWARLDEECRTEDGCDYLTIPHNSNLANGRMAPYRKLDPTLENKRTYAATRLKREPIMEIFQHKGNSECINGLSSVLGEPDELCEVEAVRHMGQNKSYTTRSLENGELITATASEVTVECAPGQEGSNGMLGAGCVDPTDFQRSGLLVGLKEAQEIGANPIKLGIIGSTDTHTATPGGVSETDWGGAVTGESTPLERLQPGLLTSGIDGNPGGLAGVWAKENTRDAIFDAMLRREVFGTSGPRIVPRLFASWSLSDSACEDPERDAIGYADGVPMGSDLAASDQSVNPKLLAYAAKDPAGQDLVGLHIVKGWVDSDGKMHNTVIPVASSEGSATLCTVYEDTDFNADFPTYYYLRVVEPPSPRWHTYDCARIPENERPAVCSDGTYPELVTEMAWTSPIWYRG